MHPSPVARLFDEQPHHPEADRSPTLAARYYVDPEIFEAEKEAIFYRSWQFAAHRSQLDAPGKFVTTRLHDQEIFLICNVHGEVRAFYNACAHRAHPLVEGQDRKQRLVCPYHAWTYDLDGRLLHARGTQATAHFERDAICLTEVRTEWLLDFAFINLDGAAAPLAAQAPGLADDVRTHLPMYDELVARGERSFVPPETRANWKVVVDNFLECYHCRTAHPTFSETLDVSRTDITVEGIVSRQSMPVSDNPGETPYVVGPDEPVQLGVFWFVWPNTSIVLPPGPPSLYLSRFAPIEPERSVRYFFGIGTPGEIGDAERARDHWATDFVGPEDIRLCEAVQRGSGSAATTRGAMSSTRPGTSGRSMRCTTFTGSTWSTWRRVPIDVQAPISGDSETLPDWVRRHGTQGTEDPRCGACLPSPEADRHQRRSACRGHGSSTRRVSRQGDRWRFALE